MEIPSIQWFPGHMAKTRRLMEANIGLVDIVLELTDARIPWSSRNPEIDSLLSNKPRLVLLNKSDMANEAITKMWISYYQERNIAALAIDCKTGKGFSLLMPKVREVLKEELLRRDRKGMSGKPVRMMIVGIPNVGKSSFINRLAGSKRAKVEDRPGVTRGKQWVSLPDGVDLLDMPGVLWPKFDDPRVGERLAFTGAVKDDVIDIEWLAMRLLELLNESFPEALEGRFGITPDSTQGLEPYELLELVGRKRGMLISGGEVNTERAAITLLDEYRSGKMGRITLELPKGGKAH